MFGKGSKLYSIFKMKCPSCHEGDFFTTKNAYNLKKVAEMHARCPVCNQSYEPEPNFYYGSMYVSYAYTVALFVAIMVLVKGIELYSLCEHHMLPFFGKAHVAYIPDGKIVGLSKIPRIVDVFSRRLQVQERLTVQIKDTIDKVLKPHGVAVVIEAQHLCMMMRGVQKQNSSTTTSSFSGEFEKQATRMEFLRLLSNDLR